jgi:hypothetical protein
VASEGREEKQAGDTAGTSVSENFVSRNVNV